MTTKPMQWPKSVDTNCLPQHKRLASGLPVNQSPVGKGPKTRA